MFFTWFIKELFTSGILRFRAFRVKRPIEYYSLSKLKQISKVKVNFSDSDERYCDGIDKYIRVKSKIKTVSYRCLKQWYYLCIFAIRNFSHLQPIYVDKLSNFRISIDYVLSNSNSTIVLSTKINEYNWHIFGGYDV